MNEHRVDLSALIPSGQAKMKLIDGAVDVWTTHSVTPISYNLYGDTYKGHCVSLPETVSLPFRLDMTVKLDFPFFFLLIGDGHITFASPWQDNRKIEDIVKPTGKPNQDHNSFNNSLPLGEFADISVICNLDEMQILINGEERFYSRKQAYMKSKDLYAEELPIRLAVSKLSTLGIKSITITETDDCIPTLHGVFEDFKPQSAKEDYQKPTFESVLSALPQDYRNEISETDQFLRALRPLKFKRSIEKSGNKITYVASDFGISYSVNVSGIESSHQFGWYIVCNGKPETWHRRADHMEETLAEISKTNPQLSDRIFYALNDCVGCYGSMCMAKTLYTHNGQKRLSCHGRVMLRMCHDDFQDARSFFHHANALMETKIANGNPLLVNKYMFKTKES